jgi:hypothetical protein
MKSNRHTIKSIISIHLLPAIIVLHLTGLLSASPLLTGGISSVHPYGAQDAARNPALLPQQRQQNNLGIIMNYQTTVTDSANNKNVEFLISKLDLDAFDSPGARLSYIHKISQYAFGFDLFTNYEYSKLKQKSFTERFGLSYPGVGDLNNTSLVNVFTVSAGMTIETDHFLGIQVNASYFKNIQKSKGNAFQLSAIPVSFSDSKTNIQEQILIAPLIGYHCKIKNSEIGIMLSTGRLTWEKLIQEKKSYDLSSLQANLGFKGKKELPFAFVYPVGPHITAGAFSKLTTSVNFGIELVVILPVTYKKPFPVPFEPSHFFYFKNTNIRMEYKVVNRPGMSLRGGFELLASSSTILSIGGGLNHTQTESRTHCKPQPIIPMQVLETSFSFNRTLSIYEMAGIDFLFNKFNILTAGIMISQNTTTSEDTYKHAFQTLNREIPRSSTKIKTITINTILALSFGF